MPKQGEKDGVQHTFSLLLAKTRCKGWGTTHFLSFTCQNKVKRMGYNTLSLFCMPKQGEKDGVQHEFSLLHAKTMMERIGYNTLSLFYLLKQDGKDLSD
jgi:hypothetical protein